MEWTQGSRSTAFRPFGFLLGDCVVLPLLALADRDRPVVLAVVLVRVKAVPQRPTRGRLKGRINVRAVVLVLVEVALGEPRAPLELAGADGDVMGPTAVRKPFWQCLQG